MADINGKKIRKSNFSPEEIEILVNTVCKHYNILYGEFAKRAINKHARHKVWLDVTKEVNRVSVEKRTLQEVKNKWKKCQYLYKEQDKLQIPEEYDSMPLEQRLSKISTDEPVLQSQPLSPTKLKVTRQSNKPSQSPKPPTPEPPNEEVCLRWNSHHSNMQNTFPNLLLREQYVDATLVAEGQTLKCHRLILSSCSPYFEEVLSGISPFQHPVLFMKDVPFWILKSLCDFMYAGEVHIFQNRLEELLAVAETLKIKGLAGKQDGTGEEVKPAEPAKPIKEEKKEEKEVRDKKRQQTEAAPSKGNSKPSRSTYASKRNERINKEIIKSDDITDPLDLLEPVYEELTKESKALTTPAKFRENKAMPVRRSITKKIKKRKLSDEREESPPPLFLSRKGTRSRPNVKIPKFYHPPYDRASKSMESPESTIVREPHTDQADPLLHMDEIKAEPLDLEDDVIEIEDNVVGFTDQEMPLQEEEIIGNYDSPIVNINENKSDENKEENVTFKKISLLQQPIIMDVHSITEKPPETLKIVDVAQFKSATEPSEDRSCDVETESVILGTELQNKHTDDPLDFNMEDVEKSREELEKNVEGVEKNIEDIDKNMEAVEKNIQDVDKNMEDVEKNIDVEKNLEDTEKTDDNINEITESEMNEGEKDSDIGFRIEEIVGGADVEKESTPEATNVVNEKEGKENDCELGFHIAKVASEQIAANEESKCDGKMISEDCSNELGFQITSIVSGQFDLEAKPDEENPSGIEEETMVNNLPEVVDESQEVNEAVDAEPTMGSTSEPMNDLNAVLSDETRLIAESLEELLDK